MSGGSVKPLVTFPDPEALVIAGLDAAFAPRAETYKPADISPSFPTTGLTKTPLTTHVQVELDGGSAADYPVTERATVRITCHAPKGERGAVKNLASLTQGLVTRLGGASIAGVVPLVGRSSVIADPATGNLMVWFTVRADLKATLLAS
jgi:hypothetical protein